MKKKRNSDDKFVMEEKQMKRDRLIGKLFLIWFIATICLMLYFSATEQGKLVICLFGHYIAMFGYMAFNADNNNGKNKEEDWIGIIFMLIGSTIMAVSLLLHFGIIEI